MKPNPAAREPRPGYPTRRQIIRQAGTLGLAAIGLNSNARAANPNGSPVTPVAAPPPEKRLLGDVATVGPLPPQPEPAAYVVRQGDTLASIAKKQLGDEKKSAEIVKANPGLDPNKALVTGQKLKLPVAAPPPKPIVEGRIRAVD